MQNPLKNEFTRFTRFSRWWKGLMMNQTTYRITLTPTPGGPPAIIRLRRLLKAALRGFGMKCLAVEEMPETPENDRIGLRRTPDHDAG